MPEPQKLTEPSPINFFDPEINGCPYPAYEHLRDEAPVWKDPSTGMFVISRYEDVRAVLLDAERFSSAVGNAAGDTAKALKPENPEQARKQAEVAENAKRLEELYTRDGWLPAPTLSALDEPEHGPRRGIYNHAFRPKKVADLDPFVEGLAHQLIDAFIDRGECDWVRDFAVPLPLFTIGKQLGVSDDDMPQVKKWTDAWVRRLGLMLTPEEQEWSVKEEIDAQNYFQPIIEQLRAEPDGSLLSELVTAEIDGAGRPLDDHEMHADLMGSLFVGGAETTTSALSAGVLLLIRHPEVWRQLKSDPDKYLSPFIEEVVRLESPVQGLLRQASTDVELHGVLIPAGSVVNVRYAAANRDERRYDHSTQIDLERPNPRTHLGFGLGLHHCLGAPLARRELILGFKAVVERIDDLWLLAEDRELTYHENFFLRGLRRLPVGFTAHPSNASGPHTSAG